MGASPAIADRARSKRVHAAGRNPALGPLPRERVPAAAHPRRLSPSAAAGSRDRAANRRRRPWRPPAWRSTIQGDARAPARRASQRRPPRGTAVRRSRPTASPSSDSSISAAIAMAIASGSSRRARGEPVRQRALWHVRWLRSSLDDRACFVLRRAAADARASSRDRRRCLRAAASNGRSSAGSSTSNSSV